MSLFDDDFYSTKVSRRTAKEKRRDDFSSSYKSGGRKWSNVRIAFVSSFSSAIIATLLFGVFFGGGDGGVRGSKGSVPVAGVDQNLDPSERTITASAKVRPAVVSIINEQLYSLGLGDGKAEGAEEDGVLREAGAGSGVIIAKKDGKAIIITNYHVVADAQSVKAILINGEKRDARVVGSDQITDLAVLEIDAKGIEVVAEIGDSSALRAAEFVMAIGNPLGLGESTTMGVVSRTQEIVPVSLNQNGVFDWEQEVIRVDAAINQGNSGGPLIDLNGRVVGINSMKISDYGVESIGFAIPINNAMPIVEKIIKYGYVPRPYLGVYTMDLEQYWGQQELEETLGGMGEEAVPGEESDDTSDKESDGAPADRLKLPDEVYDGVIVLEASGPAEDAGLQFNDVIVQFDKQAIGSTMELRKYLYDKKKIGDEIEISFYRDGELKVTKLKLADKDPEE